MESPVLRGVARRVWEGGCGNEFLRGSHRAVSLPHSSVSVEPDGKKQHIVEVLNMVDEGTSILWEAVVRSDFTAQTVVQTFLEVFQRLGLPAELRFDRDSALWEPVRAATFPRLL